MRPLSPLRSKFSLCVTVPSSSFQLDENLLRSIARIGVTCELVKVLTELKQQSTSEYIFPNKDNNHHRQYPRTLRGCIRHFAATVAANKIAPLTAI